MKKKYPIWLYKTGENPVMVSSKKEEKQIGFGWRLSPDAADSRSKTILNKIRLFLIKFLMRC